MPAKKKIEAVKSGEKTPQKRAAAPERSSPKTREPQPMPGSRTTASSKSGTAVITQPSRPPDQLKAFEAAMRLFHTRNFRGARDLFRNATQGADRGIAHRAELHVRMCERRLEEPALVLRTAEEHYNYAVTMINTRNLDVARQHLMSALAQEPRADHVYYALALCDGLSGDLQGAYENLKRAIDLQPSNRISARQDTDFASIANQPPLDRLLFPERKG